MTFRAHRVSAQPECACEPDTFCCVGEKHGEKKTMQHKRMNFTKTNNTEFTVSPADEHTFRNSVHIFRIQRNQNTFKLFICICVFSPPLPLSTVHCTGIYHTLYCTSCTSYCTVRTVRYRLYWTAPYRRTVCTYNDGTVLYIAYGPSMYV